MFEVRKTWDQHFTGRKMYALDVRVNIIDNEWPLSTSTSNISSIKHVNPTFLPQVGYIAISSCKMYICKKQFRKIFINIRNILKILSSLVSSVPHF